MRTATQGQSQTTLLLAGVVAAVALLSTGCGQEEGPSYVVKGRLALSYTIQKTPTEASGANGIATRDFKNREIRFYRNYIVVLNEGGKHGWVVPMDWIRDFAWEKE